jgi:glucose/arabinose dehydrogenase
MRPGISRPVTTSTVTTSTVTTSRVIVSIVGLLALGAGLAPHAGAAAPAAAPPATQPNTTVTPVTPLKGLKLVPVASGLNGPIEVVSLPTTDLLWVVERIGTVRLFRGGKAFKEPFANLRSIVRSNSIEQGLLGMAFHPKFPTDPRVFFFHSLKNNDNVLVSYTASADGRRIDPTSRKVLLTVDKEPDAVRHNAGALRFAPDGLLYVSVGDAARASKNGQNPKTLPGSMLRLDIDGGSPYAIPATNPFADGKAGAPEVFWYGLRNPWRFSIDAESGYAYIGDVGQETYEEVNAIRFDQPGLNFGWPLFEGTKRYSKGEPKTPLTPPIIEIKHGGENGSCSMTGGEVYRGSAIPELVGHYFYADWCLGWIRSLKFDGTMVTDKRDWSNQLEAEMVSAFGHTSNRELLVVDYEGATVSQVVPVR